MAVHIIQDSRTIDLETGQLRSKFDFRSAEKFGPLKFLLSSNASPFNLSPVVKELQRKLSSFTDEDYLLLVGNPVLIGIATAIAADANDGRVRMLQWSGARKQYIPINAADIFPP